MSNSKNGKSEVVIPQVINIHLIRHEIFGLDSYIKNAKNGKRSEVDRKQYIYVLRKYIQKTCEFNGVDANNLNLQERKYIIDEHIKKVIVSPSVPKFRYGYSDKLYANLGQEFKDQIHDEILHDLLIEVQDEDSNTGTSP